MKQLFLVICFYSFHSALGQDDFFSIYTKINKTAERQAILLDQARQYERDSLRSKDLLHEYSLTLYDTILPAASKVLNLTFPDINFSVVDGKEYSISDFAGKELIINYNYLYCQGCLNRIDSTIQLIDKTKVQVIVLFLNSYQKEIKDLKEFQENVTIGFISPENEQLISLGLGDNSMYYLNEKRQIEFLDKLFPRDPEEAWTNFLKKRY